MEDVRPYSQSFAFSMASSRSLNVVMGRTGPKISFCMMSVSCRQWVTTVGGKKDPPAPPLLFPAENDLGAVLDRPFDGGSHVVKLLLADQRAHLDVSLRER